ncbi:MAG: hypothetical protein AABX69_00285 [Nanoarchaeota archaeon]|mgnify:CR=1 FL=1
MALFGFGKKKEDPLRQPRVPVDEVLRMRRQGLSSNQIVQALQRNGYQTHQIFDALSQSDLRVPSPIQGMPGQPGQPQQGQAGFPQRRQPVQGAQGEQGENLGTLGLPPDMSSIGGGDGRMENEANITGPQSPEELQGFGEGQMPEGSEGSVGGGGFGAMPQPGGYGGSRGQDLSAKVEEISEAIIEEKWQDLMKDFNKLIEWKNAVDQRVSVLEQRFSDLKAAFDNLQKGVVEKVSDYDKSVKDVGSEMKALEQVFQKIIPTLTENVNELSRITKGMKTSPKK